MGARKRRNGNPRRRNDMRHKSLIPTLLAIVTVAALATTALAAKPEGPVKPPKPTTTTTTVATTTTVPGYWTCQARVDNNGAIWPLGVYDSDRGVYRGEELPLCVDVIAGHLDVTEWTVVWAGTTAKDTIKGLKLVFEEEVHGIVFAETVADSPTGTWTASWSDPVQNLVFVAMPHQGDKWIGPVEFTITPAVPDS